MTDARRADRAGWRRRARSLDGWQLVLTLSNCTQGEIWQALHHAGFLIVARDEDLNREWDYCITLAGENPNDRPQRSELPRTQSYRDRMMRGQRIG